MTKIINPNNITPLFVNSVPIYDKSVTDNVPLSLKIVAIYTFVLISIGSFFLKNKKLLDTENNFIFSEISS